MSTNSPKQRLEYLRGELRAERISYGELSELQGLVNHIDTGDVELLEAAGVPECATHSLYEALKAAGCKMSNHESDLYVERTDMALAILKHYPTQQSNAKPFTNRVEGGTWLDIPFAYEPWWEARAGARALDGGGPLNDKGSLL